MANIHLTTNIDIRNYKKRLPQISEVMSPRGIEIYLTKNDMPTSEHIIFPSQVEDDGYQMIRFSMFSPSRGRHRPRPHISSLGAFSMGTAIQDAGIDHVQVHYPENLQLDPSSRDFDFIVQFCKELNTYSYAAQFTMNYHNCFMEPACFIRNQAADSRQAYLAYIAEVAGRVESAFHGTGIHLVVENNGIGAVGCPEDSWKNMKFADLVPEDFIKREGIHGMTLDVAHAWRVCECIKQGVGYSNLEWIKKQYGSLDSMHNLEAYITAVAPIVRWLHFADEKDPIHHRGLHIGCGEIPYHEVIPLLAETLLHDVDATIEVEKGHTQEHLDRILNEDYPILKRIIESSLSPTRS